MSTSGFTAGDFRHLIKVEAPVETDDGAGGRSTTWVESFGMYCAVKQVSAWERYSDGSSGRVRSESVMQFVTWYRDDITTKMRFPYDGKMFNIRAIDNEKYRNKFIVIDAECGVEQ